MLAGVVNGVIRGRWTRNLGANALNATIPRSGYRVIRDRVYGPDPRHKFDLYVPKGHQGPLPVLLFFYGGGWTSGSKAIYRFLAQAFTSAGIIVAVADYRLYPQVKYPAFLEDSVMAFRGLRACIAAFGGDPDRLFLAGHSAGAYNAVMLAADARFLDGEDRRALKGVIGIAGLYDFLPLKRDSSLIDVFGDDNSRDTQPIAHVDRKLAPMLLAHGGADAVVEPGNSKRMAETLRAFGSEVSLREFAECGHTDILVSLARFFRGRTTLREDIVTFIHGH